MTSATYVDPIITAIENYHAGAAAFEARHNMTRDEEIAAIEETYGPPLETLTDWSQPATSYAGAVAAVELALQVETDARGDDLTINLLRAALAFLKPVAPATVPTARPECQSAQRGACHALSSGADAAC